jgi:hypothetical protein
MQWDKPSGKHLKTGHYIEVKFKSKEEEDGATKQEKEETTYCSIKRKGDAYGIRG